jgi:hypothetical protein
MASADFCPVTSANPSPPRYGASPRLLPVRSLRLAACRSARALVIQFRPVWNYGSALHRYARQISPGKNAMFPCTSAAFTLSAASDGLRHEVPARPQTRPSMQFLSVASHVCAPASSRQPSRTLPLPSASGYHVFIMKSCRYSHRGLPPHHIAPMLGAHPLRWVRLMSEIWVNFRERQGCRRRRESGAKLTIRKRLRLYWWRGVIRANW